MRRHLLTSLPLVLIACSGQAAPPQAEVAFHEWSSAADFRSGSAEGTEVDGEGVRLGSSLGTVPHPAPDGSTREYDHARWTSPPAPTGFPATELVASWNATTPPGTWVQVEMRGQTVSGAETGWYVLGQWASGDADILRTSAPFRASLGISLLAEGRSQEARRYLWEGLRAGAWSKGGAGLAISMLPPSVRADIIERLRSGTRRRRTHPRDARELV